MPVKDPNYSSNGLMLYLHYLRNFPASKRKFYIKSSLLSNRIPVKTDTGDDMVWKSKIIDSNDVVTQTEQGHRVMRDINASKEIYNAQTLLPIMDDCTWIKDLYSYLWSNLAKNDLVLIFEFFNVNEPDSFAAASKSISSKDGTIMYGAFDLPVHKVPDPNSANGIYAVSDYNLVFIIDNPKEKAMKPKESKNNVVMPLLNLMKNVSQLCKFVFRNQILITQEDKRNQRKK